MPARAGSRSYFRFANIVKVAIVAAAGLYVLSHVSATPAQVILQRPNAEHSSTTTLHKSTNEPSLEIHPGHQDALVDESPSPDVASGLWAITYTPYTTTGACKTAHEILSDMDEIVAAGFLAIRLYSTDCNILFTHDLVETLKENDMGLVLGVHISSGGFAAAREQIADLVSFGEPSVIQMVVVGNDAIFNDFATPQELVTLLHATKSALLDIGYDGPVTTTEPLAILHKHKTQLCPHLDVLASNIQPFFDAGCAAEDAGRVVARHLHVLSTLCGDEREAWNLETGWPSQGLEAHNNAVPGLSEQRIAVQSIWKEAGSRSAFHAFEDERWKEGGDYGVEQFWGCMDIFRR
jgi:exo-beta-1,3-glucanase (GH17 family)